MAVVVEVLCVAVLVGVLLFVSVGAPATDTVFVWEEPQPPSTAVLAPSASAASAPIRCRFITGMVFAAGSGYPRNAGWD